MMRGLPSCSACWENRGRASRERVRRVGLARGMLPFVAPFARTAGARVVRALVVLWLTAVQHDTYKAAALPPARLPALPPSRPPAP